MPTEGPYDLARFFDAQQRVYDTVLAELRSGRKMSHWMWFIFPQLEGLGESSTSRYFSIKSLDEARAYLQHPVLGARLRECAGILLGLDDLSASDVFGFPDDMKLRSSMTLFERADSANPLFARVLDKFYAGQRDTRTLELLMRKGR